MEYSPTNPEPTQSASKAAISVNSNAGHSNRSDDLELMLDEAQACFLKQFQHLRLLIRERHDRNVPSPSIKEIRLAEERLQAERQELARQRAREQEEMRLTMQQLTDAWLRLESEQLAHVQLRHLDPSGIEPCDPSTIGGPLPQTCTTSLTRGPHATEETNRTLADLGFDTQATNRSVAESRGTDELFHKLRSDLLKHSALRT